MKRRTYIFLWRDEGIEVRPSRGNTPEDVWAWAEINLRGARETPAQGKANVHNWGEVVEEGAE